MTIPQALFTFMGAALFPFFVILFFDKFVHKFGGIGGFIAAGLIIGNMWLVNHGFGLITQSGPVWVDMAFAAGSGVFVSTLLHQGKLSKALPNLFVAFLGGLIAGAIISIILN